MIERSIKFSIPNQFEVIVKVFVEVGLKQLSLIVDLFSSVHLVKIPSEDHKKVRLLLVQTISFLSERIPNQLVLHNATLFPCTLR